MTSEYIQYLYVNMIVDNILSVAFLAFVAYGIVWIFKRIDRD